MTILITGGCGFIGSEVVRQAVAAGRDVVNVDMLTYAANPHNLDSIVEAKNYQFEQVDIRDRDRLSEVFKSYKPEAVIHLAAESHVDRSIDGADDFISTNITGTFNLLECARADDARFIHISTDEVYGDLDDSEPAFSEFNAYRPSSPYAATKAASDHLVRAWGRTYNMPVIVTNCSNNYGPFQFPEKLIPVVILSCLKQIEIPVYGLGENIRDWLYVGDHAKALLNVLDYGKPGETYNIGGDNEWRNIDLVMMLCSLMDDVLHKPVGTHAGLISFVEDRPGHDRRYAVDASKIKSELGWLPQMQSETGFKKTVNWYLENRSWWEPLLDRSAIGQRFGRG